MSRADREGSGAVHPEPTAISEASISLLVEEVMVSTIDLHIIPLILVVFYPIPPAQSYGIQNLPLKSL